MPTIVVGIDPAHPDEGALELAGVLARLLDASVLVVGVHPAHGGREAAERATAAAVERLAGLPAEACPVASSSPARGLVDVARSRAALVIVLAAAHRIAGVGARVINGAPCAVAVAPRGYVARELGCIGVAFADTPDGRDALRAGVAAAGRAGARIRPISVVDAVSWTAERWPDLVTPDRIDRYRDGELRRLQAAADETCGEGAVTVELLEGHVETLVEATASLDLAICGSRGYGPVRVVLLGSVSHSLAFRARCPVLILARDAGAEITTALQSASVGGRGGIR